MSSSPENSLNAFKKGSFLLKDKKFEKALIHLQSAIAANPEAPLLWHYRLGQAYEGLNETSSARNAYQAAADTDSSNYYSWARLGLMEEKLGNLCAAEIAYQTSLALSPESLFSLLGLASVSFLQKNTNTLKFLDEALCAYEKNKHSESKSGALRLVKMLHRLGRKDQALQVLNFIADVHALDEDILKVIDIATKRLENTGSIDTAISFFRLIISKGINTDAAQAMYIRFCRRYFIFENDALALANQFRADPSIDSDTRQAAINLLRIFNGVSGELCQDSLCLIRSEAVNQRFLLNTATMLFLGADHENLSWLCKTHRELMEFSDDNLGVAHYVATRPDSEFTPEKIAAAKRALSAYEFVQSSQKDFCEKIKNTEKSLAIIGNSACELGLSQGPEIDSHDTVVRFNNFEITPPYDRDYGSKVDVIVRVPWDSYSHLAPCLKYKNATTVVSRIGMPACEIKWSQVAELISQGVDVCIFPESLQRELTHSLRRYPSNGLLMAFIAKRLRGNTGKTSFFGFSFIDQTGENPSSAHYFEPAIPSSFHDWKLEFEYFKNEIGAEFSRESRSTPAKRLKIKLVGDHSSYHAGCSAVTRYMTDQIQSAGILVLGDDYDILIVNGEGSMHHNSPACIGKMNQIISALESKKKVFLVNTVWQENGNQWDDVLQKISGISTREIMSHDELLLKHGIKSALNIDLSYWAHLDEQAYFDNHHGASVITDFYSTEFNTFVRLNGSALSRWPYIDMTQNTWSSLVLSLRTASLLVTGRHHAVYAACRARTPFVALRGNTHKIEGLIATSGFPIPICTSPAELGEKIEWARNNKAVYEEFFDWMERQVPFSLSDFIENTHSS